jgi:GntR family transcriptional regulator / MocR family aminotransferase
VASWEFAIALDRSRDTPLSRQIARAISTDIQRGRLRPGDRLPGSRTLAGTLNMHRQTVTTAVDDLIAEGWLVSKKTSGVFVADGLNHLALSRQRHGESARRPAPQKFALELANAPDPELPSEIGSRTLLISCRVRALTCASCPPI